MKTDRARLKRNSAYAMAPLTRVLSTISSAASPRLL